MGNICVITGGGSGMGLEVAKIVGKDMKVILTGRTVAKLDNAIKELNALGIEAEAYPCDVSDQGSVDKLAAYAAGQGIVKVLIHAAGVSPHMASAEQIFAINAVGTVYVDKAFAKVMEAGSVILNVSSMSAYMLSADRVPKQVYKLALEDTEAFLAGAKQILGAVPEQQRNGTAYTISKNFVVWYTERQALAYGKKGIRVVSISPGTFATPMGEIEGEEAASFAKCGALGRVGDPVEIANMMAFMVSDAASYLTGVDILYDGGTIASLNARKEDAN